MFDQQQDDACATTGRPFENAEWRLLDDGLEHRATGYFIAREMIAMRRGELWEWPLHLAEKSWCTPRSFRAAFLAAVDAFGATRDASLARSFAVAFGLMTGPANRTVADEFVPLGDVVRPRTANPLPARQRSVGAEPRAARRTGTPVPQRVGEAVRQRATL